MPVVKLLSFNIQGTKTLSKKYNHLLQYAKKHSYNIILLQETHEPPDQVSLKVKKLQPSAQVFEAPNTVLPRKGGVAIICLDPNIECSLHQGEHTTPLTWLTTASNMDPQGATSIDTDAVLGRWISIKVTIKTSPHQEPFYLTNIYAPTLPTQALLAKKSFFSFLDQHLTNTPNMNMIIGGDFNCVTDPDNDIIRRSPLSNSTPIEDTSHLNDLLANRNLIDTYIESRDEFSGPMMMTNQSTTGDTFSRIDRFYHTQTLNHSIFLNRVTDRTNSADVIPQINSTHNPIDLTIDVGDNNHIKQFKHIWRLNTSVALQSEHRNYINNLKRKMWESCSNESFEVKTNTYIQFKQKATNYYKRQQQLKADKIKRTKTECLSLLAKAELTLNNSNPTILEARQKLETIQEYETKGAWVRYSGKEATQGARYTKYHFSRAKRSFKKSQMVRMNDPQGVTHTTQEGIENVVASYWEGIMAKRVIHYPQLQTVLESIQTTLPRASHNSLDTHPLQMVSSNKIEESIKSMKLAKSPGTDGLPIEFYEIMLNDDLEKGDHITAEWLQAIYLHSFHTNQLPRHMRESQIRLLFKKEAEEDKKYPKNYRPVALLNVDYKILSKLLTCDLNPHLDHIISEDQYCMKGRNIGDLIHLIQSVIHYTQNSNSDAFLAFLDFEKAFDSVNHEFTKQVMLKLGLPNSFVRWAMLAFTNTSACCIVNGRCSNYFDLPGGGRQGDNLYPLIFTMVVQALQSLIATYQIQGIELPDNSHFKVGQYADDTTLGGSSHQDYINFKSALTIFQQASGMRINWDKSILMWLGNFVNSPFALPNNDSIKILQVGQATRVLGVMMGHHVNRDIAWHKLKTKVQSLTSSTLVKSGDDLSNTITANSILIGSCIFIANFSYVSEEKLLNVQKWIEFFIRGKAYTMNKEKRRASSKDGAVVTLLHLPDIVTTLVAKWIFKILNCDSPPPYARIWLHELNLIAKHLKFSSLDHFLTSSTKISIPRPSTRTPFQTFTLQALIAYREMHFYRPLTMTWEDIADQPIFDNKAILDPYTNKPWIRAQSPFKIIRSNKIQFVYELLTFDFQKYQTDPEIPPCLWKDTDALNQSASTPSKQTNLDHITWRALIQSIPQPWYEVLKLGNQTLADNEFVATLLPNHKIGDVYKLENGQLHFFDTDLQSGILTPTQQAGLPGQIAHNFNCDFPLLTQLKRIRVVQTTNTQRVVSFVLPWYTKSQHYNSNILTNAYTHPNPQPYNKLAKTWRTQQLTRPDTVSTLTSSLYNDPNYDLSKMVANLNKLLIVPKKKEILWRLLNNSLFVGNVARQYQTRVKKVPMFSDILVPSHCIYSNHTFSAPYTPTNPKPTYNVIASYDHILWTGNVAKNTWKHTNFILNTMSVVNPIKHWHDVFKVIEGTNFSDIKSIYLTNILTSTLWVLYNMYKHLTDSYTTQTLTDATIDLWPQAVITALNNELTLQAQLLPAISRQVDIHHHTSNLKEKARATALFPEVDCLGKLTPQALQAYQETWYHTNLVEVTNQALVVKPFRREPP